MPCNASAPVVPYNTQRKVIRDTIRNVGYPYGRRCYTRVGGYHTAMESVLRGKMWVLRILRHTHGAMDTRNTMDIIFMLACFFLSAP